ncbi:DHH family phosphoesterase [methane-oxidizing endosymbiont of Gigantopelta aegis]|uniref:DHHA1 domain-containing protein n=1 Tax=methane-oxidizing endosymbiont of Gigantopelta aegis TaxID=2794938 RepID=UPI0018DBD4B3|nr:DHH family phosphoesterase [methane-oxidizing endosymbiont of Gigantopelta aegis]
MQIDVFNGDADGICALIQLRLSQPAESKLITGVKRDIQLLQRVTATAGDKVTVLDISLAKNKDDLCRLLSAGAEILYVDHHQAGEIPEHSNLTALIDTSPKVCTSLLVNQYLQQPYPEWAIVAAYGDNLDHSAEQLADTLMLSTEQRERLKQLGIYINYNGYGASIEDLHIHPAELFNILIQFKSPFDIIQQRGDLFRQLQEAYQSDMEQAAALQPLEADEKTAVYLLPDASWARRISGVFGNQLANQAPDRAHAIITRTPAGNFQISVRAPLNLKTGADELCARFPGGGGRKAAAGINQLPESQLEQFISTFKQHYS